MKPEKYPKERLITVIGCAGAVLLPVGSVLSLGGGGIPVPGLGVMIPGGMLLVAGGVLIVGALAVDSRLSSKKSREEVIRDTLGRQSED